MMARYPCAVIRANARRLLPALEAAAARAESNVALFRRSADWRTPRAFSQWQNLEIALRYARQDLNNCRALVGTRERVPA